MESRKATRCSEDCEVARIRVGVLGGDARNARLRVANVRENSHRAPVPERLGRVAGFVFIFLPSRFHCDGFKEDWLVCNFC